MSFLSRKPSRPDGRGSGAGRADEYDEYDYAPDSYAETDDDQSPVEYFAPGGIKGRWADGRSPAERTASPGRRGDSQAAYDGYDKGFDGGNYDTGHDSGYERNPASGYATGGYAAGTHGGDAHQRDSYSTGYGSDEYATGAYELPEGADEERGSERSGSRWRRRDREDRGERTGILRLRRDRGEDIWPDDGISDEDYWASVAADRPLTGTNSPVDDDQPGASNRNAANAGGVSAGPGGAGGGLGGGLGGAAASGRGAMGAAAGNGPGGSSGGRGPAGGGPAGASPAGGGPGRLGPAPGLAGDYQPSGRSANSGPQPTGRSASSGPMNARPGTGPHAARPATGATPTVGATSSRPVGTTSSRPLGTVSGRPGSSERTSGGWPGAGQPGGPSAAGSASGSYPQQPAARPSFQPGGYPAGGTPAGGRQQADRADWGERTERIERVNASGYPEPRPSDPRPSDPRPSDPRSPDLRQGRSAGNGSAFGAPSGSFSTPGSTAAYGAVGSPAQAAGPGPARGDATDWRPQERRQPSRDAARDLSRTSGPWPTAGRGGANARAKTDDDPLTSPAYSRSPGLDTDGRSYQVAARRSQAQPKLTEASTASFTATGQYPSGQYPTGQYAVAQPSGEYPIAQHSTGQYPAAQSGQGRVESQAQAGRYPGYNPQQDRGQPDRGQPDRGQRQGPGQVSARGPAEPRRSAQSARTSGQVSLPGGGQSTGQFETQQPRPQQRPQPPSRPSAPQHLPSASATSASGVLGGTPSRGAGASASGLNPYDSAVTSSYPYPTQPYPGRPAPSVQPQEKADDRYYQPAKPTRPSPAEPTDEDGYGNSADYGRNGTGTGGYGTNGYGAPRDDRY
jgi:hypothetical protein